MLSTVRLLLFLALAAAVAVIVEEARSTVAASANKRATEAQTVRAAGLVDASTSHRLAATFTDSRGRLLADPPASPDQFIDPPTIVVAHLKGGEEYGDFPWSQFESRLAEVTGRKVVDSIYVHTPEQLDKIKTGQITLVALHAAETPFLVNNYGYQPVAVLGDDSGVNGNKLDIIVPANSLISKPADLRGKTLTCTLPSSITGYRAAVVLLMQNENLRPDVDYFLTWSLGQPRSIKGVAVNGEYEAAAVSDDKLKTLLDDGTISPSSYKMVYQSDVIPRTTIGWFYNLKPELAEQVRGVILTSLHQPAADKTAGPTTAPAESDDATTAAADETTRPMHFIAIDYKKDFDLVRRIDDRFDPRLGVKEKQSVPSDSPTTAPVAAAAAAAASPNAE
jgi:phosphonate transport system substrate-binding protein